MIVERRVLTLRACKLVFFLFVSAGTFRFLTEVVMCHVTRCPALAVGAEHDGVADLQP